MLSSADRAVLKQAMAQDTFKLGFAALLAKAQDQKVADLLNSVTGPGAGPVVDQFLSKRQYFTTILPAITALSNNGVSPGIAAKWDRYLRVIGLLDKVPVTDSSWNSVHNELVSDGLMSQVQRNALGQRQGSYAEILLRPGTIVTAVDVASMR